MTIINCENNIFFNFIDINNVENVRINDLSCTQTFYNIFTTINFYL